MDLDSLERQGYIAKIFPNKTKVNDLLKLAKRDIKTAKNILKQDSDWAYSISYNAGLQTLRALMFSKGYRPTGSNQHLAVVRFAELFLDIEKVVVFDRMRRKRHISIYDTAGTISNTEAKNSIKFAESLIKKIEKMIS